MNIAEHACSGKVFFCSAAAVAEHMGRFFARYTASGSSILPSLQLGIKTYYPCLPERAPLLVGKKVLDFETIAAVL
jgi:hypothetical protein